MARYFDRIAARFKRQEQKGMSKYGQILEDNPRGLKEALEYAAEEVTDLLMYLEEAIEKIDAATSSCQSGRGPKKSMRNLKADLEICQKATPGPWKRITKGNTVQSRAITTDTGECGIQKTICASISTKTTDDLFIASAREGWPEAIERAIKAEETLESLLDDYTMILLNVPGAATADGIVDYIERIRIENAALREENAKLLAVVEAAKEFDRQIMRDRYTSQALKRLWKKDVRQALADLEGGR